MNSKIKEEMGKMHRKILFCTLGLAGTLSFGNLLYDVGKQPDKLYDRLLNLAEDVADTNYDGKFSKEEKVEMYREMGLKLEPGERSPDLSESDLIDYIEKYYNRK